MCQLINVVYHSTYYMFLHQIAYGEIYLPTLVVSMTRALLTLGMLVYIQRAKL